MTNTCIRKSSEISPECTRENACSPEAFETDILKSTAETSSEYCMQIWIHVAWNELGSAESAFRQGHWLGNFLRFLPTTSKKDKFKSVQVPGKVTRWQKMGRSLCFHWKHWLLRPPPKKKTLRLLLTCQVGYQSCPGNAGSPEMPCACSDLLHLFLQFSELNKKQYWLLFPIFTWARLLHFSVSFVCFIDPRQDQLRPAQQ